MRKAIGILALLILAGIILPPAYFALVGEDLYERAQPDSKLLRVVGGSHMLPITHADLLAEHLLEFTN